LSRKEQLIGVSKPLLSLTIIAILLFGFFTYLSLSVSPSVNQVHVSVTTLALLSAPLNYSAYQIQNPGVAAITLSYSFRHTNGSGLLNMTSTWGSTTGSSYTVCGFPINGTINECEINIAPSKPEIAYYPNLNTTMTFTITVKNASSGGDYVFFPSGSGCGHYIVLIVGDKIPSKLPSLGIECLILGDIPHPDISVIGIENMTGLNLPL